MFALSSIRSGQGVESPIISQLENIISIEGLAGKVIGYMSVPDILRLSGATKGLHLNTLEVATAISKEIQDTIAGRKTAYDILWQMKNDYSYFLLIRMLSPPRIRTILSHYSIAEIDKLVKVNLRWFPEADKVIQARMLSLYKMFPRAYIILVSMIALRLGMMAASILCSPLFLNYEQMLKISFPVYLACMVLLLVMQFNLLHSGPDSDMNMPLFWGLNLTCSKIDALLANSYSLPPARERLFEQSQASSSESTVFDGVFFQKVPGFKRSLLFTYTTVALAIYFSTIALYRLTFPNPLQIVGPVLILSFSVLDIPNFYLLTWLGYGSSHYTQHITELVQQARAEGLTGKLTLSKLDQYVNPWQLSTQTARLVSNDDVEAGLHQPLLPRFH